MEQPPDPRRSVPLGALELAEWEGEREALRETVESQRQTIEELCEELDEERSAASTATNEAMSMILRLQSEKAQALLESRQFRRLAEERFHNDEREIESLEEELSRREGLIDALSLQIQDLQDRLATTDHPNDRSGEEEEERGTRPSTPTSSGFARIEPVEEVLEKEVVLGGSPGDGKRREVEEAEDEGGVSVPVECGSSLAGGVDESGDRVYTIDAVHGAGGSGGGSGGEGEPSVIGEIDLRDLRRRVQVLEEDREAMRGAIVDLKAEGAHLVMLREISQNLLNAIMVQHALFVRMPERRVVKERSFLPEGFSFLRLLKWLLSFLFFWRRRQEPIQPRLPGRRSCGSSSSKIGLFLLLEKSLVFQQLRCLPKARGQVFS